MPTAASMILIASEQVWPNLHAILHWSSQSGGLRQIVILHTGAIQSRDPALRLQQFLKGIKNRPLGNSGARLKLGEFPLKEIGTAPTDVSRAIAEIDRQYPGQRWVVVANGGLKTMTLGLLPAMAQQDRFEVVYSEINGGWQRVVLGPDQTVTVHPLSQLKREQMDELPLELLIQTQHLGKGQGFQLVKHEVQPVDVVGIAKRCLTHSETAGARWDWCAGFQQPGAPVGPLFERWCGGLLLQMGLQNVIAGVEVQLDSTQRAANESDLLTIYRGTFYYIELKLRDWEAETDKRPRLIEILRKATELTANFAGSSGVPLVLLPNWRLSEDDKQLVKLFRPRPRVLDASQSGQMIRWLAEQLGVPSLPRELQELEQTVQQWKQTHGLSRLFGDEYPRLRLGRDPRKPWIASFRALIKEYCHQSGQNWLLWADGNAVTLIVPKLTDQKPPNGFRCFGQSWRATQQATEQQFRALCDRFSKLSGRAVEMQELLNQWASVFPGSKPSAGAIPAKVPGDKRRIPKVPPARQKPRVAVQPKSAPTVAPKEAWGRVASGVNWELQQHRQTGQQRLWVKGAKAGPLTPQRFTKAVQRIEVLQREPGQPRDRMVYFVSGVALTSIGNRLQGQPYSGNEFAAALKKRG